MNNIDRQGIVHSDPLHVQRPEPAPEPVVTSSLTELIDNLARNLGESPGDPDDADIDAAIDGSLPALRVWAEQHAPAHAHDPDYDIPRRVAGRDLAYASVARRAVEKHAALDAQHLTGQHALTIAIEAVRLGYEMGFGAR